MRRVNFMQFSEGVREKVWILQRHGGVDLLICRSAVQWNSLKAEMYQLSAAQLY